MANTLTTPAERYGVLSIDPGDHSCDPPDLGEEASWALRQNDGTATWRCPHCRSVWKGKAEHQHTYRDDGKRWGYAVTWDRKRPSSRRWKKAERKRIEELWRLR